MKKQSIILLAAIAVIYSFSVLLTSSCTKPHKVSSRADSGAIWFHIHTRMIDSTIGGNTGGADSNTAGPGASPWNFDAIGRRIELFVPQFFISGIVLVNATGTTYSLNNVVLLKGLDSEDYYCCKVPVGTYTSASFTVGLGSAQNGLPPTTQFVNDSVPYPFQSSMWMGSTTLGYYGIILKGAYDTTLSHTGISPVPFTFKIPNSITATTGNRVVLPTRGTGVYSSYPIYIVTAGSTQYIHLYADYSRFLASINNLTTNNNTDTNPALADSFATQISGMFSYEQ